MTHLSSRHLPGLGGLVLTAWALVAAEPKPDLAEYRTPAKALTVKVGAAPDGVSAQTGYLGVALQRDAGGRLVVEDVQPDSPAAKAGLRKGDAVTRVGDRAVKTPEEFREWLQVRGPGEAVAVGLLRDGKPAEVTATLAATSRPMKAGAQRVYLGVELGEAKEGEGVRVAQVTAGSPASQAGLKTGDLIAKVEGKELTGPGRLADILAEKKPGDILPLTVRRDGKDIELKATLASDRGRDAPVTPLWTKPVFRLAVVRVAFPDLKPNGKVADKDWAEVLFGRPAGQAKDATGQPLYGSLNDYFQEVSGGALRVEGKVFAPVEVGKKRGDYVQGSGTANKTVLPVEALEKVAARDGKDAFKDFDGVLFLYAGERVQTNRGNLYYPHAGIVSFQRNRLPYLMTAEGGAKMTAVGGLVKEFGMVLGLPDLAAPTENPGSEGPGVWCTMSNPLAGGRPQHFSAWPKEKLGWVKPAVIDPTVKQKLVLAPIEAKPGECFKVLVRPDGSEYLLLENRKKMDFDADLPGEGLLIWRVVNDRPVLQESHGIDGPAGPTLHLGAVPYPSASNDAFTPATTPSSRSPAGGGLPVHIANIRRLPDGRVTFHVGYEYR